MADRNRYSVGARAAGRMVLVRSHAESIVVLCNDEYPVTDLDAKVRAEGATWIDRQFLARGPTTLGSGSFGRDVREASGERIEYLFSERMARRQGQRVPFVRDLLDTLQERELTAATR
jgi:hypothetical protein